MKKRLVAVLLTCAMAISMVACGAKEEAPVEEAVAEETAGEDAEEKPYIVFVTPLLGDELFLEAKRGYEEAAAEFGYDTLWVGSDSVDMDVMVQQIETCIAEEVDGIISCPVNPSAFEPVYAKAKEAGIPAVNMCVDSSEESRLAYVGTDYKTFGETAAAALAEKMGGKAKIAIMQGPMDAANANAQIDAFMNYCAENYPEMEVVVREGNDDDLTIAIDKANAILDAYPDVNAFWCVNGVGTTGISQVMKERNLTEDEIVFLGCDEGSAILEAIREGYAWGTVAQNFYAMGYEPGKMIMSHIAGEEVESIVDSGVVLITAENIDTYKN